MTTQEHDQQYDIIIVGAGMIGTTLACKLAQDNPILKICIIEAANFKSNAHSDQCDVESFDPRVVALTVASQQLLQEVNAWPTIMAKRYCPYTHMDVWDGAGTGSIHFDARDVGESALGYIVENSVIIEALLQQLEKTTVTLLCPAKVSAINLPSTNELSLVILENGSSLRAPLLIATDGANSPVRQMAHLETREWDYGHTAIITTVQTEKSHNYTAQQRFTDQGPLAFLPLETQNGDTHFCSIVWSTKSHYAKQLLDMDDQEFSTALANTFEHKLGSIRHITKRFSFPLIQRHCKQYYKPGVVVAGDAAHTIHPLAGQGVNLGFQDVIALADEIDRALERNIRLSDITILQRYQRRRKGPNLAMMGVMEGFKRLFSQDSLPLRWMRNEGMKRLDKLSVVKNKIIKEAMGL